MHSKIGETDDSGRFSFDSMTPHDTYWMRIVFPREDTGFCDVDGQPTFRYRFEGANVVLERDSFPLKQGEHLNFDLAVTCAFDRFDTELRSYLALIPSANSVGIPTRLVGKVLLVDAEQAAISWLQSQLPDVIRARNQAEIGTVIIVTSQGGRQVGGYGPEGGTARPGTAAYVMSRNLIYIDAVKKTVYATEEFTGSGPPATLPGDQYVGMGNGPNLADMLQRISSLPRTPASNR